MQPGLCPAYILHSRPFAEDKLILQLLLPEHGRLAAVVRRGSGKRRLSLQPFQLFCVALLGRTELKTVKTIEPQSIGCQFSGRLLFSGLYINELLCRLWPNDVASDTLFSAYQQCLQQLAQLQQLQQNQQQPLAMSLLEPCLRQFEFTLLAELGIAVDWQYDANGQPVAPEYYYQWQPEQGFVRQPGGFSGAALLAIAIQDWQQPGALVNAKQLSRLLLAPLVGEKPLASRALFSQLR
ncbi:DNA repair protein RecO [Arsukibacterium sp.]|uniref:DNA repair protein RecO n=1 Tax=Arsukibacterium sp. TaxID=1977258 RepID=UPI002FDB11F2